MKQSSPSWVEPIPDTFHELESLFRAIEKQWNIVISIHDKAGIFRNPQGDSLLSPERSSHNHSYCKLGRFTESGWDQNCLNHCRDQCNVQAMKLKTPFRHHCWKGAQEIVVPIIHEDIHVATIFAGLFQSAIPELPDSVQKAHKKLLPFHAEEMSALTQVLQNMGHGILNQLDQLHNFQNKKADRKTEILHFFYYRSHQDISIQDLAKTLFLSASRTSHLVKEEFNTSFRDLLINERMKRAQTLLLTSNYSMQRIANRIGIANEFYFSRLFKKKVGVPPNEFRKTHRKNMDAVVTE